MTNVVVHGMTCRMGRRVDITATLRHDKRTKWQLRGGNAPRAFRPLLRPVPDQAPLRSVARAKNAARAQHGTGPWPRSVVERGSVMGQRGASERHASTRHGTDISKAASGRVWASGGEGEGAGCGAGGEVSVWFGQHPARGPTVSRCLKASGMGHTEALFPELPLSPGDYRHVVPMRRDALTQRLVRPGNRNCDLSRALRLSNRWTNHSVRQGVGERGGERD